ncbi:hypothetical protein LTR37_009310 [Vermiconidia calcicola]|uniref:Uncharacterized protein n=1 Tax=Vermiconidia calcicola TaxID=1690605 RepID=A0ACC3N8D4_9PEZI|nr:hypothetical protein LTR37_009310 [Vermiconidia calcicola]
MAAAITVAFGLLFQHVHAAAVPRSINQRPCINLTLPVSVTAQNAVYDVVHVDNNIDAAAFAVDSDTYSSPNSTERIIKAVPIKDTFNISAQLCVPSHGLKKESLQIATHGGGFDKRYWNVEIKPSEYSYVDACLDAGYSILTYDRLGCGNSDKPDAYTVGQLPLDLEILHGITKMARNGQLLQSATGSRSKLSTQRRHSTRLYMSATALAAFSPSASSPTTEYAPQNDPELFGDFTSGYVVPGTKSAVQTGFFSTRRNEAAGVGGFEPELLEYGFAVRQPIAVTQLLSSSQLNLGVADQFMGPVQFMLAEFDFLSCDGDCKGAADPDVLQALYPNAKDIDVYIQKGTGHGLTIHRGADVGYKASLDFLVKNGL